MIFPFARVFCGGLQGERKRFAMSEVFSAAGSRLLQAAATPLIPTNLRSLLRTPRSLAFVPPFPIFFSSSSASTIPLVQSPRVAAIAATPWSGVEDLVGDDAPTSIELVPVSGEEQFNRIIAEAQQLEESVIFLWMAIWCRKCIYLKPKLEKLAADYYPRLRFYCVDVNKVPQRLVNRAGITKMPTIQLWRDSEKLAEVIGGHQAWLVVDDVRKMIENED